jgi:hypothetical protein
LNAKAATIYSGAKHVAAPTEFEEYLISGDRGLTPFREKP